MLREVLDLYPHALLIERQGEINAWNNIESRAAVRATGKRQVVVAGTLTDVCEQRRICRDNFVQHAEKAQAPLF